MEQSYSSKIAGLEVMRLAKKPFPLKSLLYFYIRNESCEDYETSLYKNYFENFRLLVDWLGPIEIPTKEFPKVHKVLINYEIQEIAKILGTTDDCIWHTFYEVLGEIYK